VKVCGVLLVDLPSRQGAGAQAWLRLAAVCVSGKAVGCVRCDAWCACAAPSHAGACVGRGWRCEPVRKAWGGACPAAHAQARAKRQCVVCVWGKRGCAMCVCVCVCVVRQREKMWLCVCVC